MEMKMNQGKKKSSIKPFAIGGVVIALPILLWGTGMLGWLGYGPANWHGTWVTGKIVDKVVKGNDYRISFKPDDSEAIEVLACEDSTYFMNWSSGDTFANLMRDGRYRLKVAGYRVPFRSSFRKIVDYKPTGVVGTSSTPTEFPKAKK